MADRIMLTNDEVGSAFAEETFFFNFASETSALAASAVTIPLCAPPVAGQVVDVVLGVVRPALSASGFVSGTVDFDVKINSVTCLSTKPAIAMVATSALAVRTNTNDGAAAATKAVLNASNAFDANDQICVEYNARSVGSAAAGAAGVGLYAAIKVRYTAS